MQLGIPLVAAVLLLPGPPPDPPSPNAPTAPPTLAGPVVDKTPPRPSLVALDFSGRLRRPDVPPEVAAAGLLGLGSGEQEAVDVVLARRAAVLGAFVTQNLDLLSKLETAGVTGDRLDQLGLAHEVYVKLAPLRALGTLQSLVRAVLPTPAHAALYDDLLEEYWRAVVREGKGTPGDDGSPRTAVQCVIEERLRSFGREIELAFERRMRSGDIVFHFLTDGLTLRPEQSARIRDAVAAIVERYDIESDARAQAMLGASILAHLDERQAVLFIEKVKSLSP